MVLGTATQSVASQTNWRVVATNKQDSYLLFTEVNLWPMLS